jgi:plasmid stabilization system protein ParE
VSWRVAVAATAQADYDAIIAWTAERYDRAQADRYGDAIDRALADLRDGPEALPSRRVHHRGATYTLYPIRLGRQRGRHLLACRVFTAPSPTIRVYRILHQRMDPSRHLPDANDPLNT